MTGLLRVWSSTISPIFEYWQQAQVLAPGRSSGKRGTFESQLNEHRLDCLSDRLETRSDIVILGESVSAQSFWKFLQAVCGCSDFAVLAIRSIVNRQPVSFADSCYFDYLISPISKMNCVSPWPRQQRIDQQRSARIRRHRR